MRNQIHLLLLPLSLPTPFPTSPLSLNPKHPRPHKPTSRTAAKIKWDPNAEPIPNGRFRYNLEDEFYDDGFGFDINNKQRVWWSDEYDDDDDDDEEVGFGVDDEFWVFKILKALGWMFPAVAISWLLGTGPNAFIMALAVPLGQTVISLVSDRLWGRTVDVPKPRHRTRAKKKPFARAANDVSSSKRQQESRTAGERENYRSWVSAEGPYEKTRGRTPNYGGWDDLDRKAGAGNDSGKTSDQQEDGSAKRQKRGKLSRMGRVRETPLLIRLLVAAFPFLGFWTKLFF